MEIEYSVTNGRETLTVRKNVDDGLLEHQVQSMQEVIGKLIPEGNVTPPTINVTRAAPTANTSYAKGERLSVNGTVTSILRTTDNPKGPLQRVTANTDLFGEVTMCLWRNANRSIFGMGEQFNLSGVKYDEYRGNTQLQVDDKSY